MAAVGYVQLKNFTNLEQCMAYANIHKIDYCAKFIDSHTFRVYVFSPFSLVKFYRFVRFMEMDAIVVNIIRY